MHKLQDMKEGGSPGPLASGAAPPFCTNSFTHLRKHSTGASTPQADQDYVLSPESAPIPIPSLTTRTAVTPPGWFTLALAWCHTAAMDTLLDTKRWARGKGRLHSCFLRSQPHIPPTPELQTLAPKAQKQRVLQSGQLLPGLDSMASFCCLSLGTSLENGQGFLKSCFKHEPVAGKGLWTDLQPEGSGC